MNRAVLDTTLGVNPAEKDARGGCDEAWLEEEKKEKASVEGYCGDASSSTGAESRSEPR